MANRRTKSLLSIHLAVFLFGAAGLFGKLDLEPGVITLGRTFFASLVLLPLVLIGKNLFRSLKPRTIIVLFLSGLILAFHWWSFFYSIKISTVAIGLVTFSTFPVFTTFIEPLVSKTRLAQRDILLALLVFAGIVIVIPEYSFANQITEGVFFGILSGFTFSLLQVVNRKFVGDISASLLSCGQNLFAFFCLLYFMDSASLLSLHNISLVSIALLFFLGAVCTAFAHTLFIKGLETVRAQEASIIAGLEPLYGILLAMLFLHETPHSRTIVGGFMILLAVYLSSRVGKKT